MSGGTATGASRYGARPASEVQCELGEGDADPIMNRHAAVIS